MIQITNRISGIIAIILFSAMFFLFIHSEFDIFDCHNDHHHLSHDFCLLVQNTTDPDDDVQTLKLYNILNEHAICLPTTFDLLPSTPTIIPIIPDKSTIPISKYKLSLTNEILRI